MKRYKFFSSIDQVNKEKWKKFYENHSDYNIFQTYEMFQFWGNQKKCKSFILFLESIRGECLGFCTGSIVFKGQGRIKFQSKSAIVYGGPLINEDENKEDILNYFIPKIENYLKFKSKNIEFRNFQINNDYKEIFIKNKWKYSPKVNYIIKLTTEEEVFKKFHRKKRQQINRALRENVKISNEKTYKNAKGIYDIIKNVYKLNYNEFTLPLPDLDFLLNLLSLENSRITVVEYKKKIIGGEFFLVDRNRIYAWFGGGLNVEYKKQSPISVSNWSTMKYGINNQISLYDFMGAGTKGWENRIRTYKSKYGGDLIENGMFSKVNFPLLYRIENKIFQIINSYYKFSL